MSNYLVTDSDLTSVANAIRTKGGTSASLAFPADFISAINAISGGGTNYGVENARTLLGLLYALENDAYHTGTFTVSSYFPANTESEILDTGYDESSDITIWIADVGLDIAASGTERLFMCLGNFVKPDTSGADFTKGTAYSCLRRRGGVDAAMFGNRMTSYRVNGGKLYATPKYAQTNYTYFVKNATYRWFAYQYDSNAS